ncbi:acyltransferase [Salinicoccus sp. ID82-1]|uniref:acyltransferase family protein n=1 Tax=Salinicoccus sp. ID82-1 TaxID=2820269 RepID=UPI001F451158|nr:hypothetical protein [Salinicoccus sp. ID82-1]
MKTPLEHFWAMSIQGQFYLIWFIVFTFIFFILRRKIDWNGRKLINTTLGLTFIISLSYSIYLTEVNQPWAYFDVSTRVWEFSLGGLLAVNLSRITIPGVLGDITGWFGLIGLVLTGIIFEVSSMFPGYIALWPMLCAVGILLSGNMDTKYGVKSFLCPCGEFPFCPLAGCATAIFRRGEDKNHQYDSAWKPLFYHSSGWSPAGVE